MSENIDDLPILVITDKDGYLIRVGEPKSVDESNLRKHLAEGCRKTSIKQDAAFLEALIPRNLLEDAIEWVSSKHERT